MMATPHDPAPNANCPECGAECESGWDTCWLCMAHLKSPPPWSGAPASPVAPAKENPFQSPVEIPPNQFSLATLMLGITFVAVCLGVMRLSPLMGIALFVLATPAFFRASAASAVERRRIGRRITTGEKIIEFLASFSLVLTVAAAASVAFFATCFASGWGIYVLGSLAGIGGNYGPTGLAIGAGVLVGGGVALWIITVILKRTWPRDSEKENR